MKLAFLPIDALRPTEQHDSHKAGQLSEQIYAHGLWTEPMLVHKDHHAILDGHHRRAAALELGLSLVPCLLCCYDDDKIELLGWRDGEMPQRADVFAAARTGHLLPYKTTRHIVPARAITFAIPLSLLRPAAARFDTLAGARHSMMHVAALEQRAEPLRVAG